MKYQLNERVFNENYSDALVILKYDDVTNLYSVCFEKYLNNLEENINHIYEMTESKLDLYKVGYFYYNGEMVKFYCIYDKFKAIYVTVPGGNGFRINLKNNSNYKLLNENEIKEFMYADFRSYICEIYGIEFDEEMYRINDIVKIQKDGKEHICFIKNIICDKLLLILEDKEIEIDKIDVLHWYPKDKRLEMKNIFS